MIYLLILSVWPWIVPPRSSQGQIDIFKRSYFYFQNLIAGAFQNTNKVFLFNQYFLELRLSEINYKILKVTEPSASALPKVYHYPIEFTSRVYARMCLCLSLLFLFLPLSLFFFSSSLPFFHSLFRLEIIYARDLTYQVNSFCDLRLRRYSYTFLWYSILKLFIIVYLFLFMKYMFYLFKIFYNAYWTRAYIPFNDARMGWL